MLVRLESLFDFLVDVASDLSHVPNSLCTAFYAPPISSFHMFVKALSVLMCFNVVWVCVDSSD